MGGWVAGGLGVSGGGSVWQEDLVGGNARFVRKASMEGLGERRKEPRTRVDTAFPVSGCGHTVPIPLGPGQSLHPSQGTPHNLRGTREEDRRDAGQTTNF